MTSEITVDTPADPIGIRTLSRVPVTETLYIVDKPEIYNAQITQTRIDSTGNSVDKIVERALAQKINRVTALSLMELAISFESVRDMIKLEEARGIQDYWMITIMAGKREERGINPFDETKFDEFIENQRNYFDQKRKKFS